MTNPDVIVQNLGVPAPNAANAPAPGADEQKPVAAETPATGADEQKPDSPDQQKQELSRRERARLRDAKALGRAEAERDAARAELARREATPAPEPVEPKREDFQDYEEFQRAVAKSEARKEAKAVLKEEREERQGTERQQSAATQQQQIFKEFADKETAYMKSTPDYMETVKPFLEEMQSMPLSTAARQALVEFGPQLLHHLAKNPDEAERISGLSPLRQVAELGKLEAALPTVSKKESGAPAPISQSRGSGGTVIGKGIPSDAAVKRMDSTQFAAWAKANGSRIHR